MFKRFDCSISGIFETVKKLKKNEIKNIKVLKEKQICFYEGVLETELTGLKKSRCGYRLLEDYVIKDVRLY